MSSVLIRLSNESPVFPRQHSPHLNYATHEVTTKKEHMLLIPTFYFTYMNKLLHNNFETS